jgi:hypothetical protein
MRCSWFTSIAGWIRFTQCLKAIEEANGQTGARFSADVESEPGARGGRPATRYCRSAQPERPASAGPKNYENPMKKRAPATNVPTIVTGRD